MTPDIRITPLTGEPADMAELQRVLEAAPVYFQRVNGGPPDPAEAESTFTALPEGAVHDDKLVLGIRMDGDLVGCVDLIRGFPDARTAMLGLLLLEEGARGAGIGSAAFGLVEELVRSWGSCDRIRIGVVRTNDAVLPFWRRMGFIENGEVKPFRHGSVDSEVIVLAKELHSEDRRGRMHTIVRAEAPTDVAAIRRVNVEAFRDVPVSHQTEHLIVEALRDRGALAVSLVAENEGEVIGHVAFSPASVGDAEAGWYIVGPVAVLPVFQRRGVGSALMEAGLDALRDRGAAGVVLVGDPRFYERFGFRNVPAVTYEGVPDQYVLCLRLSDVEPAGAIRADDAFLVGLEG